MRMEEKAVYINVLRILGNFGSQSEHLDFWVSIFITIIPHLDYKRAKVSSEFAES